MSAQPCGCDAECGWTCEVHRRHEQGCQCAQCVDGRERYWKAVKEYDAKESAKDGGEMKTVSGSTTWWAPCGAVNGPYRCDYEAGHGGAHRGYNMERDSVLYWPAVAHATPESK